MAQSTCVYIHGRNIHPVVLLTFQVRSRSDVTILIEFELVEVVIWYGAKVCDSFWWMRVVPVVWVWRWRRWVCRGRWRVCLRWWWRLMRWRRGRWVMRWRGYGLDWWYMFKLAGWSWRGLVGWWRYWRGFNHAGGDGVCCGSV